MNYYSRRVVDDTPRGKLAEEARKEATRPCRIRVCHLNEAEQQPWALKGRPSRAITCRSAIAQGNFDGKKEPLRRATRGTKGRD